MNNTVPTPESEVSPIVATIISWLPWAVALVVAAAIVWALLALYRSGRLKVMVSRAKGLMVKRAEAPAAPEAISADPAEEAPVGGSSSWLPRALGAAAALPTLFALPWAAWAVAHVLPVPLYISLPLGVLFDLVMVASVVLALLVPSIARQASALGWAAAVLASAAIVVHVGWSGAILFAATPLLSKALWGLLVTIRRAETVARAEEERKREEAEEARRREEEEKAAAEAEAARLAAEEQARQEAELSTELKHEELQLIAEKLRLADFEEKLAEAEVRLADAQAERVHRLKLAAIRREAEVAKERIELAWEINAVRSTQFALPAGEAPDDLSSLPAPQTSQGDAAGHLAHLGFGSDQGVSPGRPGGDPVVADPPLRDLMAYLGAAGESASVRGAAKELRVAPITIRRWRDKAEAQGLDVSALKSTK